VHHDIKPANFLYCRRTGECALVDFGLASAVGMCRRNVARTVPAMRKYCWECRHALRCVIVVPGLR
jgi:serine/threonine protein kinase